jgi:hypothetical protein
MSIATGLILLCASLSSAAGVSGTVLHQASRNWLQLQVDSVGACQEIAVDSIKVGLPDPNMHWIGDPRRDVDVWWKLVDAPSYRPCKNVRMARTMVEIPAARQAIANKDTALLRWFPNHVIAHGDGRDARFQPQEVDHAGMSYGQDCILMDRICVFLADWVPPTPSDWLDSLKQRVRRGQAIVATRAQPALVPQRRPVIPLDASVVNGLGMLSRWSAGHQAWREVVQMTVAKSWGHSVPVYFEQATGRRFFRWNASPVCCEKCDTLCVGYPGGDTLASNGSDLEISNDSTMQCDSYGMDIDGTLASDLKASDWLLLPDSSEVAHGSFLRTFGKCYCGSGRINAFHIVNDSIVFEGGKLALSALEEGLGIALKSAGGGVRVVNEPRGLRILTDGPVGDALMVRVRSVSGQILSKATITAPKQSVPLVGHGVFLVEWESRHTSGKVQVVR